MESVGERGREGGEKTEIRIERGRENERMREGRGRERQR